MNQDEPLSSVTSSLEDERMGGNEDERAQTPIQDVDGSVEVAA